MSICMDSHFSATDALSARRVFDNPKQVAIWNVDSDVLVLGLGFYSLTSGQITLLPDSLTLYYRFTDEGMVFGYFYNPSNGGTLTIPLTHPIYFFSTRFNTSSYQFKIYIQCMPFELYNKNNLPYEYDYNLSSDGDDISRITKLDQLSAIQVKGFHDLTLTSLITLPYTFFNTYKFDFKYTMYNADGTLKSSAKYHPTMFVDGGRLQDRYYPQPTIVTTS